MRVQNIDNDRYSICHFALIHLTDKNANSTENGNINVCFTTVPVSAAFTHWWWVSTWGIMAALSKLTTMHSYHHSSGTEGRTNTEKRSMWNRNEGAKVKHYLLKIQQNYWKATLCHVCTVGTKNPVLDLFVMYYTSGILLWLCSTFLLLWLNKRNEQEIMWSSPLPSLNACVLGLMSESGILFPSWIPLKLTSTHAAPQGYIEIDGWVDE